MTMLFLSTPSETPGVPHWTGVVTLENLQSTVESMLEENDELVLEVSTFKR